MKMCFFQPAVPKYRVPFFEEVCNNFSGDVLIYSSEIDFLNVKSVEYEKVKIVGTFLKFGPFYWQKKLGVPYLVKDDIAVINGNCRILNYMFLFFYYKFKGVKVIWWGQGWTAGKRGILAKIRRRLMLLSDGIALYTDKEAIELHLPSVVGLNNGLKNIDYPLVRTIEDQPLKGLFIGRITEKSNFSILLTSLKYITIDFELHVIGTCSELDDLKLEATKINSNIKVIWYGEVFNEKDICEIAINCHFFVYPGAVGLSLIHAFNYGLPALIHDKECLHMPEFAAFEIDKNGILFRCGNPKSLAEKINDLDFKKVTSMSEYARLTVLNSFNTSDMALRFCKLIELVYEKDNN
ncbi:glycosyltransferase [Pseudoalteromonas sp. TAB23]|uniref:glycosyltransferase n=1 Tax=Pseudoalteromonas sp. TAB23 TaxID=1938595 RepID=UPI000421020A|nr:glycosyltransferase [Pseudoalteromonas sp. TAB23]